MASIICRNGNQHSHASVAESRECWFGGPFVQVVGRVNRVDVPVPAPAGVDVTEGFWVVGAGDTAEYFKIQMSGRSNRLYGKKLEGQSFEYFGSAPRYVAENNGRKLTADDAKWFGHLYGRCMICARTLENEESIAAGIGPICAEKL
jgi:Family of unknown function (DUF6011)